MKVLKCAKAVGRRWYENVPQWHCGSHRCRKCGKVEKGILRRSTTRTPYAYCVKESWDRDTKDAVRNGSLEFRNALTTKGK